MLSKEFFEYLQSSLSHHDLVIIERALLSYRFSCERSYSNICKELDQLRESYKDSSSDSLILTSMRSACEIYDNISEIDSLFSRLYLDRRRSDFKDRKYVP